MGVWWCGGEIFVVARWVCFIVVMRWVCGSLVVRWVCGSVALRWVCGSQSHNYNKSNLHLQCLQIPSTHPFTH